MQGVGGDDRKWLEVVDGCCKEGECGVFLRHNCILMMCSFRSAKVAVITIANIWFVVWFGFFASMT